MHPGNSHGSTLDKKTRHFARRSLEEEVLHSAQEDLMGEAFWRGLLSPPGARTWLTPLENKVSDFAGRQPLKASFLAMALGALLVLALQRGLTRGKARN